MDRQVANQRQESEGKEVADFGDSTNAISIKDALDDQYFNAGRICRLIGF